MKVLNTEEKKMLGLKYMWRQRKRDPSSRRWRREQAPETGTNAMGRALAVFPLTLVMTHLEMESFKF